MFLCGAYQEILGNLHNLYGDTNAVHVEIDQENAKGYVFVCLPACKLIEHHDGRPTTNPPSVLAAGMDAHQFSWRISEFKRM